MNKPPFMYDEINVIQSGFNTSIRCSDTAAYYYFKRQLYQRASSVFKPKLPENWEENYTNACLFGIGYYVIFNTDKFGVIPSWCTLGGYNVQYQPSYVLVANPLIRSRQLAIDKDCVLVRLLPDYGGLMDTIEYYANMLALAAQCVGVNFINSHSSYIFASANKGAAQTMKDMYDRVSRGEPSVFVDKNLFNDQTGEANWQQFNNDLNKNYIADTVLDDLRKLVGMFDTDVGIPNNSTAKKERQIVDEVNANNVETYTKMDMALDSLKKSCKKARKMFGIDIDYDWRFAPEKGADVNGDYERNAVNTRTV